MKVQWPCSVCGFKRSSTWRSEKFSKPVICKACRLRERKKLAGHTNNDELKSANAHINAALSNFNGQVTRPLVTSNGHKKVLAVRKEQSTISKPKKYPKEKRTHTPHRLTLPLTKLVVDQSSDAFEGNGDLCQKVFPKYDEDFIYEKCNFVDDGEIGLGAKLLNFVDGDFGRVL